MARLDLFQTSHTQLRTAMFDVATTLANLDPNHPGAVAAAALTLRRIVGRLQDHDLREQRSILPILARTMPSLARGLEGEQALIAGQEARLLHLVAHLEAATPAQQPAIARRVLGQWHSVIALHLRHMQREEEEALRVLHAHCRDAELSLLASELAGDPATLLAGGAT